MMYPNTLNVSLTYGLEGHDEHIDFLERLFEDSQLSTVETANLALDLISFAQDCTSFWVIQASKKSQDKLPHDWSPKPNSLGLSFSSPLSPTENTQDLISEPHNGFENVAGFIYLVPSSAYPDSIHFQEYNLGIMLHNNWVGQGVATQALRLALDRTFHRTDVHRVQVQLINSHKNSKAVTLFTRLGFSHEGTRRHAYYDSLLGEWKDITTLAMVVTDWFMFFKEKEVDPTSSQSTVLWDAMFSRQSREREEFIFWDQRRPKRSSSMDTVRGVATPYVETSEVETDAEMDKGQNEKEENRPKKKDQNSDIKGTYYMLDASGSEYEGDRDTPEPEDYGIGNDFIPDGVVDNQDSKNLETASRVGGPIDKQVHDTNESNQINQDHISGNANHHSEPSDSSIDSGINAMSWDIPRSRISKAGSVISLPPDSEIEEGYTTGSSSSQWDMMEDDDGELKF